MILTFFIVSCKDLFQYSPKEIRLEDAETNLNEKNIRKLQQQQPKDTFRFIVTGDSQRFYEELDDFVNKVNSMHDISFVLLNGDITDFGLNREFKWVNDRLARLKVPYIVVIGNHDMLSNGRLVYQKMYGPENFSFTIGNNKFICHNSNSEEVGFDGSIPSMSWISNELSDCGSRKNVFLFSHVPPFSAAFDPKLVESYTNALAQARTVRMSIHAHQHSYSLSRPYGESVEYLVVASMNKRNFGLITVADDTYTVEEGVY